MDWLYSSMNDRREGICCLFGEFSGDEASMSTLEDFAVVEWRPTDGELDGP